MRRHWTLRMGAAALFLVVGTAPAQPLAGGGHGQHGMAGGLLLPLGIVDLNDEQRAQMRKLRAELHKRRCDISGRMLEQREEIRELYMKDRRDPKAIGKAYGALSELRRALVEVTIDAENRAEAMLTDEQRERLKEWRRSNRDRMYPGSLPFMMHPGMEDPDWHRPRLQTPGAIPPP